MVTFDEGYQYDRISEQCYYFFNKLRLAGFDREYALEILLAFIETGYFLAEEE